MAVMGQDGVGVDADDVRGASQPAHVLGGPRYAEGDVQVGIDGHAGGADLAFVAGPAGVGGHPGGAGRRPQRRRPPRPAGRTPPWPRSSSTPGGQAGPAAHHPPGVGQVHGVRGPVRACASHSRRSSGAVGHRPWTRRSGSRSWSAERPRRPAGLTAGLPPGTRVATAGPSTSTGTRTRSSSRGHRGADLGTRHPVRDRRQPGAARPRPSGAAPAGGEPGGQVASVGRGGQDHQRKRRSQHAAPVGGEGPRGRSRRRSPAHQTALGRRPARSQRPGLGARSTTMAPPASATASSAPTGSRPSRTTTTATASAGAGPSGSVGPGEMRHRATATRWPSITAAWARRGARQSPTRCTGNGSGREGAPQAVLGLLVDGADHPVADRSWSVPVGWCCRVRTSGSPTGASGRRPATPIGHQVHALADALGVGLHVPGLHVQGDPEILAHHHAVGDDLHRQPRSASSSATEVAWWKPSSSTTTTVPVGTGPTLEHVADVDHPRVVPAHHGRAGRAPVATITASGARPATASASASHPVRTSTPRRWAATIRLRVMSRNSARLGTMAATATWPPSRSCALEQDHLVAPLGGGHRGLQPAGAAADHHHLPAPAPAGGQRRRPHGRPSGSRCSRASG